ncbi:MAG: nucleotidyltransferase domain-containing protein [archaeon]|nr:nucleotidyltransferase domain-containing protein [archaeon]
MKTKSIKKMIKEYFFLYPTVRLRVRQIERDVNVPLPSAIRYTKELEEEAILKRSVISGINFFSADRVSENYILEKRLYNIKNLFFSGFVRYIINEMNNPTIVLFGSYSKGEDVEGSDIDIYVESRKGDMKSLKSYEKKLQRDIQIFFYKNIHDVKNKDLANNIINGVTLNGFLEVLR